MTECSGSGFKCGEKCCVTAGATCGTAPRFEGSRGLVHVCMDTDTFEGALFWPPVEQRADGKLENRF